MFKELYFQFNGKSSKDFNLNIVNFDGSGLKTDMIGIPLEIEEAKIKRNPKPFFFGTEVKQKLEFKLQLGYIKSNKITGVNEYLSRGELGAISKWLFKKEYKEFKIIDKDYSNIIYNVIFQNPKQIEIADIPYGIEVDVVCDRAYGIRKQTIIKSVGGSLEFNLKNLGFYDNHILPEIEITATQSGDISIKNITDDDNTMTFTNLNAGEIVYVNNQTHDIISSLGINRNENFNFNWFRITPDYYNRVVITGNATVEFRIVFPMPF